jgi:hypothetical protein
MEQKLFYKCLYLFYLCRFKIDLYYALQTKSVD